MAIPTPRSLAPFGQDYSDQSYIHLLDEALKKDGSLFVQRKVHHDPILPLGKARFNIQRISNSQQPQLGRASLASFRQGISKYSFEGCRKKTHTKAIKMIIGRGMLERKDGSGNVLCDIKQTSKKSDIGVNATVFQAYLHETGEKVGECSFEIITKCPYCDDEDYSQNKNMGIIRIDSFARDQFRGIGTMLMQAVIEYGIANGTEGRVSLHSCGTALGFYQKLGMKLGIADADLEQKIREESLRAVFQRRDPVDLLINEDAALMILPKEALERWREIICHNPVLFPR